MNPAPNPSPSKSTSSRASWWIATPGLLIALFWGFAEATFFFVIPDVFLSFVAIFDVRSTWRHLLFALLGATLGGALLFHWAELDPVAARYAVAHVPFVRDSMFLKVEQGFRKQGIAAMAIGSVSGLPYKLYAVEAPKFCSESSFLLATPLARSVRFVLVWLGFGYSAAALRRYGGFGTPALLKIYGVVWFATYALYWGRILSH